MRELFIDAFRDVTLHLEKYRILDTLEPCSTLNKHSLHKGQTGIEECNIDVASSFHNVAGKNCASVSEVSPLRHGM